MSGRLKFERYFRFHDRIKPGAYPNTWPLEEKFEIQARTIQPFHLMCYMGNWHLLVCGSTHRQEILDFSVAHIKIITPAEETTDLPEDMRPIRSSTSADFRALVKIIFRHGAEVQVAEPVELKPK